MVTEAQLRAKNKYNRRVYETIAFRSLRDDRLNEQIALAAERAGISRAQYMLEAIRARLDVDRITIESLPDVGEDAGEK